jgi:hypothetical protein
VFLLITTTANAGNYTWNGATSTNWSTTSNWSPAGIPSTNDTVTLSNGGVNSILLDGNRTITRLVISANTIDLNTYELHVSGRSSLNGGAINNGNLKIRGSYAYFQGTNFNCILDVITGHLKLSGGTFDKAGSFEQNGSASGWGLGGCTFNDDVTIKNTGTVYLRMGQDAGDTFNGKVYLYSSGNYSFQMAYGDTSYFNDTIFVNSTGNGGISFANGTYGASILGNSACLVTGSTGISAGTIQFKNMVQSASSSNSITASGSVLFNVYSNSFLGKVNFTAPNLVVKSTTFGDSTSLTKTGSTLANTWEGANTYHGVATITNGNTGTAILKLASQSGDIYNKDVYFNAGSGPIQAASVGVNTYNGNVIANGNAVTFSTNGGTFKFTGSEDQIFGGGTSTLVFNKIIVDKTTGHVTLNQPITIDSLLQLTSGIIYTDTIITLKATATTTGASNQSFVDGRVKKIGNTAFVFPVGDEGKSRPISISAPSQLTDAFTAQYFYQPQEVGNDVDTTIGEISQCNYWNLQRSTGSSNVYVSLSWDSIGCCVLDSSQVIVINWSNSIWKNIGVGNLTGVASSGNITSSLVPYSYGLLTIGRVTQITYDIFPVVNRNNLSEGWYHAFDSDEPIFGYNGGNVIEQSQSWNDYTLVELLKNKNIKSLRIPAGTTANYWDWREGWFFKEHELPQGWLYDKVKYLATKIPGNELSNVKPHIDWLGGSPVYLFNLLTSDFYYELASLYRANQINLPVKFVELGNEYYLNEFHYRSKFPSVKEYSNACNDWTYRLKSIQPFENVRVAAIGCDAESTSPSRRRLWLQNLLINIDPNVQLDAVTIHQYYGDGLGSSSFTGSTASLKTMLSRPFKELESLQMEEFNLIKGYNSSKFYSHPLKTWITEFNLNTSGHTSTGTWAHGLFHAAMALSYLESQLTTSIISHTMSSDVVFGNIFESQDGFASFITPTSNVPTSTNQYEFTALGAAYDQIAKAARYATSAYKVDFSAISTGVIPNLYTSNEDVKYDQREIYAWVFESDASIEVIALNLGKNNYRMYLDDIFPTIGLGNLINFESINCADITAGIKGSPVVSFVPGQNRNFYLYTTEEIPATQNANGTFAAVNAYSLTRISQKKSGFMLNVTDDHICTGSTLEPSTTSLIITGGIPSFDVEITGPNTSLLFNQSDSVISFSEVNGNDGNYTITVTDQSGFTASASIVVDKQPTVTVTSSPALNSGSCTTGYQLEASISPSPASPEFYNYLWTPSTGLENISLCYPSSQATPMSSCIYVNPDKTTNYQVYIYDGNCWSRSDKLEVSRAPVNDVNLGEDLTVCSDGSTGPTIKIISTVNSDPAFLFGGTYTWTLLSSSSPITLTCPLNTECDVQLPAAIGEHYRVHVELSQMGYNCTNTDEMEVSVTECCDCAGGLQLLPSAASPVENFIYASKLNTALLGSNFSRSVVDYAVYDENSVVLIEPANEANGIICVNGDLIIDRKMAFRGITFKLNENCKIRILDNQCLILLGCSITICNRTISAAMWDGIVANTLLNKREPCLFIDMDNTTRSSISNAKAALQLGNNVNFILEGIDFSNNYLDLDINNYSINFEQDVIGNGGKKLYSILNNSFTSSGNVLIAPYLTKHKLAAIRLNDVERFVVGDSNSINNRNYVSSSMFGVQLLNSSMECYNTSFSDVNIYEEWPIRGMAGSAIVGNNFIDEADRKVAIGHTTATSTLRNYFIDCENGIYINGNANINLFNNKFGDGNVANNVHRFGINILNNIRKSIFVTRGNEFFDYNIGVRAFDLGGDATCHIGGNVFHNALQLNGTSFEGTAIHVSNPREPHIPTNATLVNSNPRIRIFENVIGSSTQVEQPRIGIFVSLLWAPAIENNEINFYRDGVSVYPNGIGIRSEGTVIPIFRANNIRQISTEDNLFGNLIGIVSHQNIRPCISLHDQASGGGFQRLGYGIQFIGDQGFTSLSLNEFDECDHGVFMQNAWIGTQGSANRTDDNQWIDSSTDRVKGTTINLQLIPWYFNQNLGAEFEPNGGILFKQPISPSLPAILCPILNTAAARNASFGSVVGDTARYEEGYEQAFSYHGKLSTFKSLKLDTTLIILDDPADDSFVAFYQNLNESNLQLFNKAAQLATYDSTDLALELVSSIEDTNSQESALKETYTIYFNEKINHIPYSNSDTLFLEEQANEKAILNGNATLMARNILFSEVHETIIGNNAKMANPSSLKQNKVSEIILFPNPAKSTINIHLNNQPFKGRCELFDLYKKIDNFNSINGIYNNASLESGSYFLKLFDDEGNIYLTRFNVVK